MVGPKDLGRTAAVAARAGRVRHLSAKPQCLVLWFRMWSRSGRQRRLAAGRQTGGVVAAGWTGGEPAHSVPQGSVGRKGGTGGAVGSVDAEAGEVVDGGVRVSGGPGGELLQEPGGDGGQRLGDAGVAVAVGAGGVEAADPALGAAGEHAGAAGGGVVDGVVELVLLGGAAQHGGVE